MQASELRRTRVDVTTVAHMEDLHYGLFREDLVHDSVVADTNASKALPWSAQRSPRERVGGERVDRFGELALNGGLGSTKLLLSPLLNADAVVHA